MNARPPAALARVFLACALLLFVPGCSPEGDTPRDGYYSARAAEYNPHGWQEFITLYVLDGRIITVEYNARNLTGLVMSWDLHYLDRLKNDLGLHPNQIIREYSRELLNRQNPELIRPLGGDTLFFDTFRELAAAALTQAKAGNRTVAGVALADRP